MLLHAPDVLIADSGHDVDDDDGDYDHGTAKAFAAVGFYYKAQMRG